MNTTTGQGNLTANFLQLPSTDGIHLAYNIYLGICMILGVILNTFVIFVQFKNGDKTSSDWWIAFMNLYDLLISAIVIPIFFTYSTGLWKLFGNDVICKIHMTLCHFTIFSSAFLIVGLSLERYFKVCKPTKCKFSRRFSRNLCISISIATLSCSLPSAFLYGSSSGNCELVGTGFAQHAFKLYYLCFIILFVASFVTVIFSYSNIAVVILKSKSNLEKYSTGTENDNAKVKCGCFISLLCCGQQSFDITATVDTVEQSTETEQRSSNDPQVFVLSESRFRNTNGSASMQNNAGNTELMPAPPVRKDTKQNKRVETTRLTFLLCLIFVLTWAPPWVWYAIAVIWKAKNIPHQTLVACDFFLRRSYMINVVTNPILMILLNTKFRENAKNILTCRIK